MELLGTGYIDRSLPVIVGVSGGADSMALLHRLNAEGYSLVIAHCNFHLRGAESDRDEAFVRHEVEERYPGQGFAVVDFDTYGYAKERKVSIEMAARDLRYRWFRTIMEQYGASCIAIAHHADDQIETLLLNLSRGTGGQGLVGMESYRDGIWRPLLGTSRSDILAYLERHQLPHVEDSTNQETVFKRNLIRQKLIPLFEELNPSFRTSALRSMHLFAREQMLIDSTVSEWVHKHHDKATDSFGFSGSALEPLILYRWLTPKGFSADQVDKLYSERDHSGAIFTSSEGILIERFRGKAYFITIPSPSPSQVISGLDMTHPLGDMGRLIVGGDEGQLMISPKMLERNLVLRYAEQGDKVQVFGQKSGSRLLADFLKDKGIPASYRTYVPVLAEGDRVHAVLPLQISEEARVAEGESPILLHFEPGSSPLAQLLVRSNSGKTSGH